MFANVMRNGRGRPTDVANRCSAPPPCAALFAPAGMLLVVVLGVVPLMPPPNSAGNALLTSRPDTARVLHLRKAGTLLASGAATPDEAAALTITPAVGSIDVILDVGRAAVPAPAPRSMAVVVSRRGPSPLETARVNLAEQAAPPTGGGAATDQPQLAWPVRGVVTSPFGWRTHPIFGTREFHRGIDIAAPSGVPVASAYAGTVRFVGWENGYGRLVVVSHGGGLETAYAHLAAASVRAGQHVAQGQEIGRIGSTGWSTGPHLLFEVFENGVPQNPAGYLH
jgi:murein DD-endopeptidase MepM/ murein hydrolase activator NlpD